MHEIYDIYRMRNYESIIIRSDINLITFKFGGHLYLHFLPLSLGVTVSGFAQFLIVSDVLGSHCVDHFVFYEREPRKNHGDSTEENREDGPQDGVGESVQEVHVLHSEYLLGGPSFDQFIEYEAYDESWDMAQIEKQECMPGVYWSPGKNPEAVLEADDDYWKWDHHHHHVHLENSVEQMEIPDRESPF